MKSGKTPEDLINLLRRIRFGIQEETLEVLCMNNAVDSTKPWCIFRVWVLEGSEITVEISQLGYVMSQVNVPQGLENAIQVEKHCQSISSVQGHVFPNLEALLMSVSQQYKLRLYPTSQHATDAHHALWSFVSR